MVASMNAVFEKTAHALGYQSAIDFTRIELRNQVAQKLAYFKGRISVYEQKYNMGFEEFMRRVPNQQDVDLKQFGVIEKEDDLLDWEDSQHSFEFYQRQLVQLIDE
jgi:hypothetical protein